MTTDQRCYCGAPAELGIPIEDGMRWLCPAHAPWQCVGCGPDSDEDNYPDTQNDDEETRS